MVDVAPPLVVGRRQRPVKGELGRFSPLGPLDTGVFFQQFSERTNHILQTKDCIFLRALDNISS